MRPPVRAGSASRDWIARLEVQEIVFAEAPNRARLLAMEQRWPTTPLRLHVHRNFPAELVVASAHRFFAWAGFGPVSATYGGYDDSLTFSEVPDADVHVVLLDGGRYQSVPDAPWWIERLTALATRTPRPIVFAVAGTEMGGLVKCVAAAVAGITACDLSDLLDLLGDRLLDRRGAAVMGTALSPAALHLIGQRLGLVAVPAALGDRARALVLDLDDTLVGGAIGELGPAGVLIDDDYRALHDALLHLRERGVFLALLSQNEEDDVRRLFAERPDLNLQWEHFSATSVSWEGKPAGLAAILDQLRIAADQVVVVDNNVGEIARLAEAEPLLRFAHARSPRSTLAALRLYPGLAGTTRSAADDVRIGDLAANEERARLQEGVDPGTYIRSLGIELAVNRFGVDIQRAIELSAKTNQFNLALRRIGAADAGAEGVRAATVALHDRLSDSGVVGALWGRLVDGELFVDDLCISCRALGRGVEDAIVRELVLAAALPDAVSAVIFRWQRGPRNGPGMDWLARVAGCSLEGDSGSVEVPISEVRQWAHDIIDGLMIVRDTPRG